jgi:hypothetical protein
MPSKRQQALSERRQEKRARRQRRQRIVLFLVEGPSEIRALEPPIAAMLDTIDGSINVKFQMMSDRHRYTLNERTGGDVTSKTGVEPGNVAHVVEKVFLTPFFRKSGLYPTDVERVVHIVDTDGCFIPDDRIEQAPDEATGYVYTDECLLAPSVAEAVDRNARKRENMLALASISSIKASSKSVPYGLYFFSSNMDHFLYGEANLKKSLKESMAKEFAEACCRRPSLFFEKMQGDERYCRCDHATSWERIREGTESLAAHSNLGALIAELTGDRA